MQAIYEEAGKNVVVQRDLAGETCEGEIGGGDCILAAKSRIGINVYNMQSLLESIQGNDCLSIAHTKPPRRAFASLQSTKSKFVFGCQAQLAKRIPVTPCDACEALATSGTQFAALPMR